MKINDQEFQKLIADVEEQFGHFLAKAEKAESTSEVQALSKSEDEGKKEEPKEEEKKEEPKEESKPEHKEGKESKPEEKADEDKAPEHKEGEEEGHGYDDEDMEHMHQMYGSMNKHELKAHHDAVKMALDKCMGMNMSEETAPAPMEMSDKMQKSEAIAVPVVNQELALVKSELDAERAKSDELKKSMDLLTQVLSKLVKKTAPPSKAITSLETVSKTETVSAPEAKVLTSKEIASILSRKAQDPKLTKSDRDAIDAFYFNKATVETINHLLK